MHRALLLFLALAACSSGGGPSGLSASEQAIVDCTRLVVRDLARILSSVEDVLSGEIGLTPDAGFTFLYETSFDGTTMTGQVTFPQDPASGIPLGEDVVLTFSLDGPLRGSGSLTLVFSGPDRAAIRGGATLDDDLGCSASLVFQPALPLEVRFGRALAGTAPAAALPGIELWGPMAATITAFEQTQFTGDLEVAETTQEALLDGSIGEAPFRHVFSLFPDAAQLQELVACLGTMRALHAELFATLDELAKEIDDAGADLTALPEIEGFTVTPVSASNATYVIDAAAFGSLFTAGTIRGSVRLTRVNFETTAFWSWRIDGEVGEDRAFGSSLRFYEIAVANGTTNRRSGEGTLGQGACSGSFEDADDVLTVRSAVGPHTLAIDFSNGTPQAARVDGIAVPLASVLP